LKIQIRIKLEFSSEFYILKSREIWMLDQKEKLFQLKISITMQSFEIFELQEDFDLYF
jgi:hypothetical protein